MDESDSNQDQQQNQQNDNQQFDGVSKQEQPTTLQGGQVDRSAYKEQSNTEEPDDQTQNEENPEEDIIQEGIVDPQAYTNIDEEPKEDSDYDTTYPVSGSDEVEKVSFERDSSAVIPDNGPESNEKNPETDSETSSG